MTLLERIEALKRLVSGTRALEHLRVIEKAIKELEAIKPIDWCSEDIEDIVRE
jgi:hypothetical protein